MNPEDIKINLEFNLTELNVVLALLGQLPYASSAATVAAIHGQALPQIPKEFFQPAESAEDPVEEIED